MSVPPRTPDRGEQGARLSLSLTCEEMLSPSSEGRAFELLPSGDVSAHSAQTQELYQSVCASTRSAHSARPARPARLARSACSAHESSNVGEVTSSRTQLVESSNTRDSSSRGEKKNTMQGTISKVMGFVNKIFR